MGREGTTVLSTCTPGVPVLWVLTVYYPVSLVGTDELWLTRHSQQPNILGTLSRTQTLPRPYRG